MKEGEVCYLVGLVFKISFRYDMVCCHQCQRGRLLDNFVLDVTEMSYQSLILVHQAQKFCNAIYSANRAHSVIEENEVESVYQAHSVNEGNEEDSVNQDHSVINFFFG